MNLKDYLYLEWIETASDEELIAFISKFKKYDRLEEEIAVFWKIVRMIEWRELSEELQLKLVDYIPQCCDKLFNPTEKVKLEAIKNGCSINNLRRNLSEECQLEAVRYHCWCVELLENPSEAVQIEAIVRSKFDLNVIYKCKDWKKLREKILDLALIKDIIE